MTMLETMQRDDGIEVLSVSRHEWRVRDSTLPANDGASVLGFVARIGEMYEIVRIGQPLVRTYASTLEAAVAQIVASVPAHRPR